MKPSPIQFATPRFGIGRRLWLAFGIVIASSAAGGAVVLGINRTANSQTDLLVDVSMPENQAVSTIQIALLQSSLHLRTYGLGYAEADFTLGTTRLSEAGAAFATLKQITDNSPYDDDEAVRQIGAELDALTALAARTQTSVLAMTTAQTELTGVIAAAGPLFAEHRTRNQDKLIAEIAAGESAEALASRSRKLAATNACEQLFLNFVQAVYRGLSLRDSRQLDLIDQHLPPVLETLNNLRGEHSKPEDQQRVDRLLALQRDFGAICQRLQAAMADIATINRERAGLADSLIGHLAQLESFTHDYVDEQVGKVQAAMERSLWAIAISAGVSVLVGMLASTLLSRRIVGPVQRTTAALAQVAVGDLTPELQIPSQDELGLMASGLNATVERLRHYRRSTGEVAEALNQQAQVLSGSSQSLSHLAEETSAQAATVASAAAQVGAHISTVATAAQELAASVHDVARSSTEAAQVTTEARQLSQHAQGVISKLSVSSEEIGSVAREIESIAQKTNLLALNATIEAASAGEAGRGFAVVAGEVKDLARQTAAATADITKRIHEIQAGTADAVSCLGDIAKIIARIDGFEQSISAAVQEQAATTDEITRTATDTSQATQAILGSIQQVATATGSTAATVSDLRVTADKLAALAGRLQILVNAMRMEIPSSTTIPRAVA